MDRIREKESRTEKKEFKLKAERKRREVMGRKGNRKNRTDIMGGK